MPILDQGTPFGQIRKYCSSHLLARVPHNRNHKIWDRACCQLVPDHSSYLLQARVRLWGAKDDDTNEPLSVLLPGIGRPFSSNRTLRTLCDKSRTCSPLISVTSMLSTVAAHSSGRIYRSTKGSVRKQGTLGNVTLRLIVTRSSRILSIMISVSR